MKNNNKVVKSPCAGVIVDICVKVGDEVNRKDVLLTIESMKMQYPVKSNFQGEIKNISIESGQVVEENQILIDLEVQITKRTLDAEIEVTTNEIKNIRLELKEVIKRYSLTTDQARPYAVKKRHAKGMSTARENIANLIDKGSFNEYGALLLAGQRRRFSEDELVEKSPADGLITGTGSINSKRFTDDKSRCLVMAYDYSVFAGTQGIMNHKKMDRMLMLAKEQQIPVVLFAEGGGGRPSDTDFNGVTGLDCHTFVGLASLSGLVPTIGIVAGRCFAGNAALLGVCNVIIATEDSTIGMAGPAMIEGGGLGSYSAEEVGPISTQGPNGVIDILVKNELEAVEICKKYLSYFQGDLKDWKCQNQENLRNSIPKNRKQIYNIRELIETFADSDSVLELRKDYSLGMITALIRIEGKPFGLIANNPGHLGGAIEASAGDKVARFMQLCDGFDIPMISLCDTPGFMVGPEAEKQATVRHISRIFVMAASLTIPFFTLVLRKGYGLGAQAMAAGSFHSSIFTAAWPSGEFGAMGIEGAIKLAYSKQLKAIKDPQEQQQLFDELVLKAYEQGKAINIASYMEIDAVIDPALSRDWIIRGLKATLPVSPRQGKKRPCIDTW
ncbi:MAG: acetyl-CoA carboxylase carboxyltransferase component [Polaribacter sp.]|jgi:acetyl-CoA carboxylase carboxyltransferase component